jgi:hypothetical protein
VRGAPPERFQFRPLSKVGSMAQWRKPQTCRQPDQTNRSSVLSAGERFADCAPAAATCTAPMPPGPAAVPQAVALKPLRSAPKPPCLLLRSNCAQCAAPGQQSEPVRVPVPYAAPQVAEDCVALRAFHEQVVTGEVAAHERSVTCAQLQGSPGQPAPSPQTMREWCARSLPSV